MTLLAVLFTVGVLLLGFEIIVPGGFLGVLGGLALLGGCVLSFVQLGSSGGLAATGLALVLAGIVVALEFFVLPRTSWGKRMFLRAKVSGNSQPMPGGVELVGKAAVAATTLAPSGYVMVDGKRFEAFCRSGFAEAGTSLNIVAVENFRLIVSIS